MPESLPGATTALREELEREKEVSADLFAATTRIGEALAAANARAEKAEQLVCDFQAAAMIDVGNMGGKPKGHEGSHSGEAPRDSGKEG